MGTNIFKKILVINLVFLCVFSSDNSYSNEKFKVKGDTLYYDSDLAKQEIDREITFLDVGEFKRVLSENKIKTVVLNSQGGIIEAAFEAADLMIDFDVDTHISGLCFSACYWLFLAGNKRTMERGSKLGFHQSYFLPEDIETYYNENKKSEGWNSMYEYASILYEETQNEIYKDFEYQLERGVTPRFIMQTIKVPSDQEFFPRRKILLDAGVLTQ